MKTQLIKISFLCALALAVFSHVGVAQVADSTVWPLFAANFGVPDVSANLVADSNLVGPATGWLKFDYKATGQRCNLGAAGWPAGETDTAAGRYVEFTTAAKAGRSLTVTNVSLNYGGASSTNAVKGKIFYSVDAWKTFVLVNTDSSILYPNSTMSPYSKALNVKVPVNQKFSLRVYPYWVLASAGSSSKYSVLNTVVISGTTQSATSVKSAGAALPVKFELSQNYPNPFNPSTQIKFSLNRSGYTTLKIFDILGHEVATLVSEVKDAGVHTASFNASHLPSGIYLSVLSSGGMKQTNRMVLMK